MSQLEEKFAAVVEQIRLQPSMEAEESNTEALVGIETVDPDEPEAPVAPAISINVFNHPDVHPVVLDLALLKKYGPEWMFWEPEVLQAVIPDDFHTSQVSALTIDKIQSVKTLHTTNIYWERWEVFNWCTQAFAGVYPDFDFVQASSVGQMMVSIDVASRIRGERKWSTEVEEFIRQSCRFSGVFCPPEPLDFLEVGTVHGLVDCEQVAELWPKVRQARRAPSDETIVAEQLRRNLEAYLFLEESRSRLESQLEWVLNV